MVLPLCRFSRNARTPDFIRIIKSREWEKVLIFRTRPHFALRLKQRPCSFLSRLTMNLSETEWAPVSWMSGVPDCTLCYRCAVLDRTSRTPIFYWIINGAEIGKSPDLSSRLRNSSLRDGHLGRNVQREGNNLRKEFSK